MNPESVLLFGGLYHFALIVFHLCFWKLFHWKKDLASLTLINRAVMQILNLCLIFVFLIFGFISILYPSELLIPGLGRSLLLLISIFWLFRAIDQIIFFGVKTAVSLAFFLYFMLGSMIYLYPFLIG